MALAQQSAGGVRTVPLGDPAVRNVLSRHCHQPLADDRAAPLHAVAGRLLARHPGLHAGGHGVPAAGDPDVHGVVLLGVPRQGEGRYRLSLIFALYSCAWRKRGTSSSPVRRSGWAAPSRWTWRATAGTSPSITTARKARPPGPRSTPAPPPRVPR